MLEGTLGVPTYPLLTRFEVDDVDNGDEVHGANPNPSPNPKPCALPIPNPNPTPESNPNPEPNPNPKPDPNKQVYGAADVLVIQFHIATNAPSCTGTGIAAVGCLVVNGSVVNSALTDKLFLFSDPIGADYSP